MSHPFSAALTGLALLGAGCATVPPADRLPALQQRMVLTWHQNLGVQPDAIVNFEAQASRIAGVPVRRLAAVDGRVIAVALECSDPAACEAASRRLRADSRVVDLVTDRRRERHDAPQPSSRSN